MRRREFEPGLVARAKVLYEETDEPVVNVAAMLGVAPSTLTVLARRWGWRTRRERRALAASAKRREADLRARAGAALALAAARAAEPVGGRDDLVGRIRRSIEREVAALDAQLAEAEGAGRSILDPGRTARALSILVRTLRDLESFDRAAREEGAAEEEAPPRDMGELRERLAERLRLLGAEVADG